MIMILIGERSIRNFPNLPSDWACLWGPFDLHETGFGLISSRRVYFLRDTRITQCAASSCIHKSLSADPRCSEHALWPRQCSRINQAATTAGIAN